MVSGQHYSGKYQKYRPPHVADRDAEVPPLVEIVEIDVVDLVHHLPQQLTGFHIIVSVLKHVAHHATMACPGPTCSLLLSLTNFRAFEQRPRQSGHAGALGEELKPGDGGANDHCLCGLLIERWVADYHHALWYMGRSAFPRS